MSAPTPLPVAKPLGDVAEHLQRELDRLDLVIRRRIQVFRQEAAATEVGTRASHAYVSDAEADALLAVKHSHMSDGICTQVDARIASLEKGIGEYIGASADAGSALPLPRLAQYFGLTWLELQILVVCLAPELRRKYDRLYAYLQDDIARKRPSLDLVLELFIDDESQRWRARTMLDAHSALFRHRLVQVVEDAQSPSGSSALSAFLQLDERILQYILGNSTFDARLSNWLSVVTPNAAVASDVSSQTAAIMRAISAAADDKQFNRRLLLHVHGADGVARRDAVFAACRHLGCPVLVVDGQALLAALQAQDASNESLLRLIGRESLLMQAPLLIDNLDDWLVDASAAHSALRRLIDALGEYTWLAFTSAARPWPTQRLPRELALFDVELTAPTAQEREQIWTDVLRAHDLALPGETIRTLAADYRLNAAQIRTAAMRIQARGDSQLARSTLSEICRGVSHQGLRELGVRVATKYRWEDLILPIAVKDQLQDICRQVRYRRRVFEDWGFGDKLAYGRALSVLFSGSPGTGKTMAAQVLADELRLDLFKIDLSGVVSKYIGETEKNLSRVFNEAQIGNAILFFDEADALFGKRTEVADAHDRYANIEVSYLLQRMEEYDGIVILASNFRNNMDEAFVRRIRFIVDFPFPDELSRAQIWRGAVPGRMPVAADVNFDWLAGKIKIAGGSIKNIVLNAAFNAAHEDRPLSMTHLLQSSRYEFQKIGKLWDEKVLSYRAVNSTSAESA